jgi:AAA15 family ATPase/GTPase
LESRWSPVVFNWKDHNNKIIHSSSPYIADGRVKVDPSPESLLDCAYYAANHTYSQHETVSRFSDLSRKYEQDAIIERFKTHFKDIEDLSIELNAGFPAIHAKVPGLKEKLPLALLSGGMNKLASILFAMPTYRNGIILIDEIENGFHYKRFPEVWRSILQFADAYDVQVFAATHSLECLEAVADVASKSPEEFSLIHAGKDDVRQSPGTSFVGAMEEQVEIR